jgi:two-component system, OmpR family, sensor histidine kinase ArlS
LSNAVDRLKRLNKNLLLLSKIGASKVDVREKINVNEIINLQYDFFEEQGSSKNIEVKIIRDDLCNVDSNSTLLDILIGNLFSNAIKHNVINGELWISIFKHKITFTNTGVNETLPDEKLFKRFSKINSSETGSGLGLSIVKKIVDLNSWGITYRFTNQLHVFELIFENE